MKKIKSNSGTIEIVYEDTDYLIINKPAGLIVHEAFDVNEENLSNLLTQAYPEIINIGDDPKRPGIVHRLDREVSGLMIIPRSPAFFPYIKKQFQARKIEKIYEAIVYGKIIKDEGVISFPIIRSKAGHKMAALPLSSSEIKAHISNREQGNEKARLQSKEALTDFKVEKKWPHVTLLTLKLITGRTHQIRVHLSAFGHPLLGDNLYGTAKTKRRNEKLSFNRIFLFSKKLSFTDLKGEKKEFKLKRPMELQQFLDKQK
jgi:23S rRNA pseudouridine1911/1915/1917 synthase